LTRTVLRPRIYLFADIQLDVIRAPVFGYPQMFALFIITREVLDLNMVKAQPYTLIRQMGEIEIREYPKSTIATVLGLEDYEAFGHLFNYIEGHNETRTHMPMTTPVLSTGSTSEKLEMTAPVISDARSFSFVLPAGYDTLNAPEPLDDQVKIVDVPGRRLAVLVFSGRATPNRVSRRTKALRDLLERGGIETKGDPFLMRYNSPFSLPFLRRNEVALEVADVERDVRTENI